MNDIRHFKKKDAIDNRLEISNHQQTVPKSKLSSGSGSVFNRVFVNPLNTVNLLHAFAFIVTLPKRINISDTCTYLLF